MVHKKKYTLSFTAASALITETIVIAEEYHRLKDWELVLTSLRDNNLMNKIKDATFKREFSEIKKRISLLTSMQIKIMIEGSLDDAKAMILLSMVKMYSLLNDFIVEVLRTKYMLYDRTLTEIDYIKFYNTKSISHAELDAITDGTAKKVKQVIFKMLEQIGLITSIKNGTIIKPLLSNEVRDVIIDDDPSFLNAFLYTNEEIKILLQNLKHA